MNSFPDVGGTVGMFRDAILSISRSKQEDLALGAALAIAGTLTANRFSYNGIPVYTHLYVLNLATTSAGKGATIDLCRELFSPAGLGRKQGYNLLGMGNYSSDAAIISRLEKQRTRIDVVDEFGQVFKGFAAKGDRRASVAECLKGLYTAKKFYAGHETKTDGIKGACHSPAVSIVGTVQPSVIENHVTPEMLFDGFLGRFLYFIENISADYLGHQVGGGIDPGVLDHLADACFSIYPEAPPMDVAIDGSTLPSAQCDFKRTPLTMSREASELLLSVDREHYLAMRDLKVKGDFSGAAMGGREIEQAQRIAWILCVSDGCRELSVKHFMDARSIVKTSMSKVADILKYAAEDAQLRPVRKVRELLKKAPGGTESKKLLMKNGHLTAAALKVALDTLTLGGEVEEFTREFQDKQGKQRDKHYVRFLAESQPGRSPDAGSSCDRVYDNDYDNLQSN